MAVNVKLLQKVRDKIAEEPRRLDMRKWGLTNYKGPDAPPCGTVACIAGWITFCVRPDLLKADNPLYYLYQTEHIDVEDFAANAIGIGRQDCPFYEMTWGVPEVLAWIDRQIDAAK